MKQIIPYLIIPGQCQTALEFYRDCFAGQIKMLQTYRQAGMYDVSKESLDRIAHAEFQAEEIRFFASDGFEGQEVQTGTNLALSVDFESVEKQQQVFDKLKVGGKVTLDFSQTSDNSTLATLVDRYGFHWYLNHRH